MGDVLTKVQRSYNMSQIRGKNTGPEVKLRKLLYEAGVRDYKTQGKLPGKPDVIFQEQKVAVFVDGCFWHKCPACFVEPETRKRFWLGKIDRNVKRDREVNNVLRKKGWKVVRFWEHDVKKRPTKVVHRIIGILAKTAP